MYLPAKLSIAASRLFEVFVTNSSQNPVQIIVITGQIVRTKQKLTYTHVIRESRRGFVIKRHCSHSTKKFQLGKRNWLFIFEQRRSWVTPESNDLGGVS